MDTDRSIEALSNACHLCASVKNLAKVVIPQSTGSPPDRVGSLFAADIMRRTKQYILIIRECVTSYTVGCIIENEKATSLRDILLHLCSDLRPLYGSLAVIRTDPAPGFLALRNDKLLQRSNLKFEIGRIKNPNKNPVADKAIRELEDELIRLNSGGSPMSRTSLSQAIAVLNSRIRFSGVSA